MEEKSAPYVRSHELMSRDIGRLLVVDVQAKLIPLIAGGEQVVHNCRRLIQAAQIFSVPVDATEQYPKGLGETVPELRSLLPSCREKLRFSCAESLEWEDASATSSGRYQVVICGIEAHVCVLQTTLDLLSQGYQVFVVADAVSSRKDLDCQTGLRRMNDNGATIVTTESVMFEWCEVSGTVEFKQISQLIKES